MGAGASLDPHIISSSSDNQERYFCHSCHRVFGIGNVENPDDLRCPHCESTFLEELVNHGIRGRSSDVEDGNRNYGALTVEQARRITSATAMLRLLESQLRDELNHLQQIFESRANQRNEQSEGNKGKKFTKIMQSRCRNVKLNLDLICSQPSCPICSEDFVLGEKTYRLPCSHVFHETCVSPWLQMKQNCPICRAEISDELPTKDELQKLSKEEIIERVNLFDDLKEELPNIEEKAEEEMIDILIKRFERHKSEEEESERSQQLEEQQQRQNTMALFTGPRVFRIDVRPNQGNLISHSSSSSTSPSLFAAANLSLNNNSSSFHNAGNRMLFGVHSRSNDEDNDDDDSDEYLSSNTNSLMINNTRASNGYYSRNHNINRLSTGGAGGTSVSPQYRSFMQLTSENSLQRRNRTDVDETNSLTTQHSGTDSDNPLRARDDRMMMMWRTLLNEDPFSRSSNNTIITNTSSSFSGGSGTSSMMTLIPRSSSTGTFTSAGASALSTNLTAIPPTNGTTFQILSANSATAPRVSSYSIAPIRVASSTYTINNTNTTNNTTERP